jgi:hypothetical protein
VKVGLHERRIDETYRFAVLRFDDNKAIIKGYFHFIHLMEKPR